MLTKGYHYLAQCDEEGCQNAMIVGVKRFSIDEKKAARQEVRRLCWEVGPSNNLICPQCNPKIEVTSKEDG